MATREVIKQVIVRTTREETTNVQDFLNRGYKVVMCNKVTDGILEYVLQGSETPISLEKN